MRTPINGVIGFLEMVQQNLGIVENENKNLMIKSLKNIAVRNGYSVSRNSISEYMPSHFNTYNDQIPSGNNIEPGSVSKNYLKSVNIDFIEPSISNLKLLVQMVNSV